MGQLGSAGGIEYVMELAEHVPTTLHLDSHIELVIDASLKREIIETSSEITNMGFKENINAIEYVTRAEEMIFAVSQKEAQVNFLQLIKY